MTSAPPQARYVDAPSHSRSFGWRTDIQALRGLAVLLVVIDHARFRYLPGGFLGVDIFFVISGFMITGIIVDDLDGQKFTFRAFYARRVRRLFPAAYATIIVTLIAGAYLIDPFEFDDLVTQVVGAFTFTVNFVLWRQTDYFSSGATLKPLLHMWSLSIEEQFYLLLPVALLFTPKRWRLALLSVAVVASMILCFYAVRHSPSAAFYFLPFRAWELGLGSVAAVVIRRFSGPWLASILARSVPAAILLIIPIVADERGHPGLASAAVCLATAVLLVTSARRPLGPAIVPFVWFGDRSYSLYLTHWPVLAFANNVFTGVTPGIINALFVGVGMLWMELQYRLVERPMRTFALTPSIVALLIIFPAAISGAAFAYALRPLENSSNFRIENFGFSIACNYKTDFAPVSACQSSNDPKTMIWGDSFAMHLVEALTPTLSGGLIQATRTVCGPFLNAAPVNGVQYTIQWGEQCLDFNRSVLEYLNKHQEIETVVLSSSLLQYLPGGEDIAWRTLVRDGDGERLEALDAQRRVADLASTVAALHKIHKRVALVAPPPSVGVDIGRCLSRLENGLWIIPASRDCAFDRAAYARVRGPVLSFLTAARAAGVVVIPFDDFLCADGRCKTRLGSVNLYRDAGHLSVQGSALLGREMKLGNWVQHDAR